MSVPPRVTGDERRRQIAEAAAAYARSLTSAGGQDWVGERLAAAFAAGASEWRLSEMEGYRNDCERLEKEICGLEATVRATREASSIYERNAKAEIARLASRLESCLERDEAAARPIPMRIHCPCCGTQHIDIGELATRPHTSHTCQNKKCGLTWKVATVPTVGVQFLPGSENE